MRSAGFLAGWFDTIKYMRTHKDASVKIAADTTKVPEEVVASLYGQVMPMFSETGRFDRKALTVLARSFVDAEAPPERARHVEALYREAAALRGREFRICEIA